jgi:hypothetical protein
MSLFTTPLRLFRRATGVSYQPAMRMAATQFTRDDDDDEYNERDMPAVAAAAASSGNRRGGGSYYYYCDNCIYGKNKINGMPPLLCRRRKCNSEKDHTRRTKQQHSQPKDKRILVEWKLRKSLERNKFDDCYCPDRPTTAGTKRDMYDMDTYICRDPRCMQWLTKDTKRDTGTCPFC